MRDNDNVQEGEELSAFDEDLHSGEVRHAKKTIIRLGKKRFGEPDSNVCALLEPLGIEDLERLERILDRIFDVRSWNELLATR